MLQDGDVKQLLDPVIKEEFNSDQVERMILAASLCLRQLHHTRPQMAFVRISSFLEILIMLSLHMLIKV